LPDIPQTLSNITAIIGHADEPSMPRSRQMASGIPGVDHPDPEADP